RSVAVKRETLYHGLTEVILTIDSHVRGSCTTRNNSHITTELRHRIFGERCLKHSRVNSRCNRYPVKNTIRIGNDWCRDTDRTETTEPNISSVLHVWNVVIDTTREEITLRRHIISPYAVVT